MTAKEQGLPELPEAALADANIYAGKVAYYYTADQMRAYALAALASDTGERGVPALEVFRIAGGDVECCPNPTAAEALECLRDLRECYTEALRAQPAGGGEVDSFVQLENVVRSLPDGYAFADAVEHATPPESGGQGEAAGSVQFAVKTVSPGWMHTFFSVDRIPDGTKLYTHPPAQASGAVTELMVDKFIAAFNDTMLFPEYRANVRTALTAALTQGGGNGR